VVAHVRAGRVVATGTHADLLVRDPGYRALVARDGDEPDAVDARDTAGLQAPC
jgi:hypothetical protein